MENTHEGSLIETLGVDRHDLPAAGEAAAGEFHCAGCGYGVTVQRLLPLCPMCGGRSWEPRAVSVSTRVRPL